jgi:hypothetical protein
MQRHIVIRSALTATAWVMFAVAIASAQAITNDSKRIFLPTVQFSIVESPIKPPPVEAPSDRPTPYDVEARDVVIRLEDTPDGFYIDSAARIEPSDTMRDIGFVSGYETQLVNEDDIFVSYFAIDSLAYVFMSTEGAQILHDAGVAAFEEAPGYVPLSVSTIGDETAAFVNRDRVEGFDVEAFLVVARRGNVNAIVLVGGLAEVTHLSNAVGYAQRMLDKAADNDRIAVLDEEEHDTQEMETSSTQAPLPIQEWVKKVDAHVAAQLQLQ